MTYYNAKYLCHHGIKGQVHGVRNYQNYDGTLTDEGRRRYGIGPARGSNPISNWVIKKEKQAAAKKKEKAAKKEAVKKLAEETKKKNAPSKENNYYDGHKTNAAAIMKDFDKLTTRELQEYNSRITAENTIRGLANKQKEPSAADKTKKFLNNAITSYNTLSKAYSTVCNSQITKDVIKLLENDDIVGPPQKK